jgi:hypothetical protein
MRVRIVVLAALAAALLCAGEAQAKSPAVCGPQDRPETALQGQLPQADRASGRAADGYTCNLTEVGFYPSTSFANFRARDGAAGCRRAAAACDQLPLPRRREPRGERELTLTRGPSRNRPPSY